jgi:hypothetical protein
MRGFACDRRSALEDGVDLQRSLIETITTIFSTCRGTQATAFSPCLRPSGISTTISPTLRFQPRALLISFGGGDAGPVRRLLFRPWQLHRNEGR